MNDLSYKLDGNENTHEIIMALMHYRNSLNENVFIAFSLIIIFMIMIMILYSMCN